MLPDPQRESKKDLSKRLEDLQTRLDEAEETIRALSSGDIDAIVSAGPEGDRVYTLKGADETYQVMVQEMAEGALTLTRDGVILFSNKQFATMLQRPLERVIGARLFDFVEPKDFRIISDLLTRTGIRKAELRLKLNGVASLPVYFSLRNVFVESSECLCLIVTDLSDQKRYEELLAVMEAVPVGVFIAYDADCVNVVGNRMGSELLRLPAGTHVAGMASGGMSSSSWRVVKDGRDLRAGELPMQIAARSGLPVHDYELDLVFDDGSSLCLLCSAVPLFDPSGRARGAVSTFVDITSRKRAVESLESTNAELHKFAHVLAHGLQQPLGKILESVQLLAAESKGNLGADAVAGVLKMPAILAGLLRYWEITERDGQHLSTVDCNRLLSLALLNLRSEIQDSAAIVTSDPLPTVVADEVVLLEVFQNLIGNAVQYRGAAAPRIHVSAVSTGDRWQLSVRDNGTGVAKTDFARIFDLFQSVDTERAHGAGFGLALCRKVIERSGGRIWVDSEVGQGSAFKFTIPIYLEPATA